VPTLQLAVVLHIPHSSTVIPDSARGSFLLTPPELQDEILRMTDAYTDELFRCDGAATVRYPVSRIVVDPERFDKDADEVMSQVGMGVVYTNTSDGRPLRLAPTPSERVTLLAAYYHTHHAALTDAVTEAVRQHGRCLIIDCHSFPSFPLPYELDQRLDRPHICIGTDPFHTPVELADGAMKGFQLHGYTVALDRPFAGALVPATFYHRDAKVAALMIEVNRALYMDESTGEKSIRFDETRAAITEVLTRSAQRFHLFKAYEETDFIVDAPGKEIHLRIGRSNPEADTLLNEYGVREAAFITAWNPGSKGLSRMENDRRQHSMEIQVESKGFRFLRGRGKGADPSYIPEESMFVFGIPRTLAIELSGQFGQIAIVWHEMGKSSILISVSD
jgi:N-formylglutamate deformylase